MLDTPSFAQGRIDKGVVARGFGVVTHGDDSDVLVEFFREPVYNEFQSMEQGKAVYDDRIFLRMAIPGDKTKQPVRYAQLEYDPNTGTPPDSDRWPRAWAAFQNGEQAIHDGTPLKMWPVIAKHQVDELSRLGCHTVEQLANIPDSNLHNLGAGSRMIRDMAIDWLAKARDDKALTQLERKHSEEIAAMRSDNESLKAQMDALMARFNADPAGIDEAKRGPGRPRKEPVE